MTKNFLVFPTGVAGVALLILRVSIAAALGTALPELGSSWMHPTIIVLVAALLCGLFARLAAALGAMLVVALCIRMDLPTGAAAALHGLSAIALAMLGPGGYSVDALLFGRRVIRLDE